MTITERSMLEKWALKLGRTVETPDIDDEGNPKTGWINAIGRDCVTVHFPNGYEKTYDKTQVFVTEED